MARPELNDGSKVDEDAVLEKDDESTSWWRHIRPYLTVISIVGGVFLVSCQAVSVLETRIKTAAESLGKQITEIKADVRQLDVANRESDKEIRQNIQGIENKLTGVQIHLQKLSSDVEHLADDVDALAKMGSIKAGPAQLNNGIIAVSNGTTP